jgi:hypothetical protein
MKIPYLHVPFYFGLSVFFIGALFKIQHWYGGEILLLSGIVIESTFVILVLTEILTSKKATKSLKIIWCIEYSAFPVLAVLFFPTFFLLLLIFIGGTNYLNRGRKRFIVTRKERNFDSIDL